MASDNFSWDVIIRLATQGAKGSADDLQRVGDAVDQLQRENKISEKAAESNTRAINKLGQSASGAGSGLQDLEKRAISLRYANQDLAQSMFTVSAAITAAGVGAVTAFASQERAFADVIRTTTDDVSGLEDAFRSLSTEIPNSFNELAQIGTLGNQLGVSGDQLEDFTRTIAEFSTVTGISAEESALAFGKLGNLLGVMPKDYDRLASSIALVGRETAATEKQIISVAGEIAPAAAAAGFTADQVVGLSGALASLKVPPERSRSTILQFFETLNMAVASGGDKLENFAKVVGVTSEELSSMVRSGQGAGILEQFLGNVSSADTIEVTQALDALGLAGLRTNPTIRALAGNMQLLNQSLADGKQGWTENTELQRQMDIILTTLSAKWQIFLNAALNAAATIGSSVAPAFAQLLTVATDLLVGLQQFAASDFGQNFFRIAGAIAAAIAAYTALRGIIALASASLFTFVTISRSLGGAGIVSGLQGMASAFGLIRSGANGAATATFTLSTAFKALGKATIIIGLVQLLIDLFTDFGGVMINIGGIMVNVGNFFLGLQKQIGAFASTVGTVLSFLSPLLGVAGIAIGNSPGLASGLVEAGKGLQNYGRSIKQANNETQALGDTASNLDFGAFDDGAAGLGDLGGAAAGATKQVRTLADYASDLQSVFSRAFDIRYSSGSTLDKITQQFREIEKASQESARNIQRLKAEIQGLQSDIGIQQYFLGIAIEYGDTKRAEAIQANIAKLQADLADKTANLSEEQSKNSKELVGNSDAALANRQTMESLVQAYQEHLTALASSGLSQQEVARRAAELKAQFIQQATQLGFNTAEVMKYAAAFDDLIIVINNVPRNITVTANINPAIQAFNEFVAKSYQAGSNAGSGIASGIGAGMAQAEQNIRTISAGYGRAISEGIDRGFSGGGGLIAGLVSAGLISGRSGRDGGRSFATGGYTGSGGKYEPAGVVHKGEYVLRKDQVNQRTGLPFADALGRLQKGIPGRSGYAGGGYVSPARSGGLQMTSLGPMAVQQFGQLFDQYMKTYLDGQVIADSSSQQYARSTRVGAS